MKTVFVRGKVYECAVIEYEYKKGPFVSEIKILFDTDVTYASFSFYVEARRQLSRAVQSTYGPDFYCTVEKFCTIDSEFRVRRDKKYVYIHFR